MLVNYDEYRRQRDTLDILSDPDMMEQIRRSRRFYAGRRLRYGPSGPIHR